MNKKQTMSNIHHVPILVAVENLTAEAFDERLYLSPKCNEFHVVTPTSVNHLHSSQLYDCWRRSTVLLAMSLRPRPGGERSMELQRDGAAAIMTSACGSISAPWSTAAAKRARTKSEMRAIARRDKYKSVCNLALCLDFFKTLQRLFWRYHWEVRKQLKMTVTVRDKRAGKPDGLRTWRVTILLWRRWAVHCSRVSLEENGILNEGDRIWM
ncbi:hypothetical protein EVAR_2490_1 [Eumeta japonica]|uniref:Uncharacterized protein n=1 Tax=Eumeta variegata TaxID=151549 RepID=A0A4C1SRF0_EUMVA|nr:hypothetical protein EVAR_2490_1 [Eumeta japonica]